MRTVDTIWKLLFGALIGLVVLVFLIVSSVTVKLSLPTADLAYSTSTASSTLKIPNTNTNTTSTKPIITNPATTTISHSTTTKATSSTNTIINATSSMPKIPDLSNSTSTTKKLLWGAYVGDGPNNLKNLKTRSVKK